MNLRLFSSQPRTQALRSDTRTRFVPVRYERQNEEPGYDVVFKLGGKMGGNDVTHVG